MRSGIARHSTGLRCVFLRPLATSKPRARLHSIMSVPPVVPDPKIIRAQLEKELLWGFVFAAGVAAVPIVILFIAALAAASSPEALPRVPSTDLQKPEFWALQIILLTLSICGNALVDMFKALLSTKSKLDDNMRLERFPITPVHTRSR